MKRVNRANLIIGLMIAFTFLALASSVTGTLAWYAYSTRVLLSFTGMAVRQTVQLELGVVDNSGWFSNAEIDEFNLVREPTNADGKSIVWNKASSGLTSDMLGAYLNSSPYAKSELSPVSTLGRSGDDTLTLYEAPETGPLHGFDRNYGAAADKNIVKIPFAFKVLNARNEPAANQRVWITDAVASSLHSMQNAIRVYVDNDNANGASRYLFRPASRVDENPGETVVAGMLDLDNDGYYDYDASSRKEYLYGDISYVGDVPYGDARATSTGFIDENSTGDTSQDFEDRTTFYSRHLEQTKSPSIAKSYYKTAAYETKKSVYPTIVDGDYTGGLPVVITPDSTTKIAYATLTIFIEGWDHAVIDQAVGEAFYLGLTFEINKV